MQQMSVRIVSLNIQHGGGKRIARLSDWLATKSPSVVVLPEWRNNVGGQRIRKQMADSGFQTVAPARATSKINSVLLAATDLSESQEVTPRGATVGNLIMINLFKVSIF